jgi:retinol dehydrogenase-12
MTPPKGSKTAQDYELQMGTNVLGSFLLTKLLLPIIEKTAASSPPGATRVTFAGSLAVDLMSPTGAVAWTNGEPTVHSSQEINYGQSKAGNALLASALRRRCEKSGVISNAWNPGNLNSELQRHMPSVQAMFVNMIVYPVQNGAYTELFAGWGEEAGRSENGGKFIIPWGRFGPVRGDVAEAMQNGGDEKLWEWCEKASAQYA